MALDGAILVDGAIRTYETPSMPLQPMRGIMRWMMKNPFLS